MRLTHSTAAVGGAVLGVVLTALLGASTYDAQAARMPSPAAAHHTNQKTGFVAPVPHRYGANGMRMGLHCETSDLS